MNLIPITYHSKKYPVGVMSNIDEIAGNFDKDTIKPQRKYSLHTEYSHMKRKLNNKLINKYPELKKHLSNFLKNKITESESKKNRFKNRTR